MNSVAETFSSPKFQRYMLWFGVVVLAAGATALIVSILGGTSGAPVKNDPGFHPQLPAKSVPLRNSQHALVKTYQQLDPGIRDKARRAQNPYGDGHASQRIVAILRNTPLDDRLLKKEMASTGPEQPCPPAAAKRVS